MDLHRDAASAFGPASLTQGALLPFEGRTLMTDAGGLPPAALDAQGDGWLSPQNPLLVRGPATILPLAWRGDPQGSGVDPREIAAFASQMQNAGMYWAGNWRVLSLMDQRADSIGSYTSALRDAGATSVDCWTSPRRPVWLWCGPAPKTRGRSRWRCMSCPSAGYRNLVSARPCAGSTSDGPGPTSSRSGRPRTGCRPTRPIAW